MGPIVSPRHEKFNAPLMCRLFWNLGAARAWQCNSDACNNVHPCIRNINYISSTSLFVTSVRAPPSRLSYHLRARLRTPTPFRTWEIPARGPTAASRRVLGSDCRTQIYGPIHPLLPYNPYRIIVSILFSMIPILPPSKYWLGGWAMVSQRF